jgi:hypothetical protein
MKEGVGQFQLYLKHHLQPCESIRITISPSDTRALNPDLSSGLFYRPAPGDVPHKTVQLPVSSCSNNYFASFTFWKVLTTFEYLD